MKKVCRVTKEFHQLRALELASFVFIFRGENFVYYVILHDIMDP
jgi:hypothetical protein